MADGEEGQKTEEPTEHKLQEARKKGQIFKSTEIVSALQFAAMALALAWTGSLSVRNVMIFAQKVYGIIPHLSFHGPEIWRLYMELLVVCAKVLFPIFGAAVLSAFIFNVAQIGFIFSVEPLNPTLDKISPVQGFKRLFSRKSFVELGKQLFKVIVIGTVVYKVLMHALGALANMVSWDLRAAIIFTTKLMFQVIWYTTAAYIAMAAVDFLVQRKFYMMQMKMSIQELKDEFKDTEGDPQVKARFRQMQRQMLEASMMREVPKASAVVTNPTHLAVALKYEQGRMEAPVVVAKGERLVAEQIREIAVEHEVPVIENVGLARALFKVCAIGQMIPGDMYRAVAEVLAFVFRLKRKRELSKRRAILRIRESKLQKPRQEKRSA